MELPKDHTMDVEETQNSEIPEKTEIKLPFSIDSLLAHKFVRNNNVSDETVQAGSSSNGYIGEDNQVFQPLNAQNVESDEEDDDSTQSSEHVDVESNPIGESQETTDTDFQISGSSSRGKRARTAFSAQQIKSLEAEFEKNRYLSVAARGRLARQLRLTETQEEENLPPPGQKIKTIATVLQEVQNTMNILPIPSKHELPQIKIWFQNRRTKWKRKYTNDVEVLAQQYYSSLGIVTPRPMFVGDRLWIFNCPSRIPPSQQQQWMKSISNIANINTPAQIIDRSAYRTLQKPPMPFIGTHPNMNLAGSVKIPAQNRMFPREIFGNMASTAHFDAYRNNILNHSSPAQESNVDHLRRLEENFSI